MQALDWLIGQHKNRWKSETGIAPRSAETVQAPGIPPAGASSQVGHPPNAHQPSTAEEAADRNTVGVEGGKRLILVITGDVTGVY